MAKVLHYTDIVVLNGKQPVKSFSCDQSVEEALGLAKHFVLESKMTCLRNGDALPELTICRNGVDLSYNPPKAFLDADFQKAENGMIPTDHETINA